MLKGTQLTRTLKNTKQVKLGTFETFEYDSYNIVIIFIEGICFYMKNELNNDENLD